MTRLEKALVSLPTLSPGQLREKWAEVSVGSPPSVPTPLLRRLLAQRCQEKRYGGLPLLVVRELERMTAVGGAVPEPVRKVMALTPGTRLIREWNGRTIAVEVRDGGFVWEDRTYRSLSEIAREVTGAHWSGPRFFGLRRHG
jgi:Protein of unknown function (DUF2924)